MDPNLKADLGCLPFQVIRELCTTFVHQSELPNCRPIHDYIREVVDAAQPTLLRNLLHIEVARRRATGEQPTANDYIKEMPAYATLIKQVFLESTSFSPIADTFEATPANCSATRSTMTPFHCRSNARLQPIWQSSPCGCWTATQFCAQTHLKSRPRSRATPNPRSIPQSLTREVCWSVGNHNSNSCTRPYSTHVPSRKAPPCLSTAFRVKARPHWSNISSNAAASKIVN